MNVNSIATATVILFQASCKVPVHLHLASLPYRTAVYRHWQSWFEMLTRVQG